MPNRHRHPSAAGAVLSAGLAAAVLAGCDVEDKRASTARVERVIAGDLVVLSRVGTTRLIGVNAPEEGRCGGIAATRFTRRQLEDKRVRYELGEDSKDRWGRTLAYLRRDGKMHNLALVQEGFATAQTIAPNTKYAKRLEAAEREAKQQKEGALADCARKREELALKKRQELALKRARAKEQAERAERAEQHAERLRAIERRAKRELRRVRGNGDDLGREVSRAARVPKRLLRRLRLDTEPPRRSDEQRRRQRDGQGR